MKYPPTPQSKSLLDMEVANYCEGLDPSYSTLGFENAEVLYGGGGKRVCMQTHKTIQNLGMHIQTQMFCFSACVRLIYKCL